jgi:hypothetical protein
MADKIPEKARLLQKLMEGGFNVPPFIYLTPDDFKSVRFEKLEAFLARHCSGYKVIARSAHPQEEDYKGGTFDSFGTHADVGVEFRGNFGDSLLNSNQNILRASRRCSR